MAEVVFYRISSGGLTRGGGMRIAWDLGLMFLLLGLPGNAPGRAKLWLIPAGARALDTSPHRPSVPRQGLWVNLPKANSSNLTNLPIVL